MRATDSSSGFRLGLLWRFLLAALVIAFAPLALISAFALNGYQIAGEQATESTRQVLDEKSLESLQLRTEESAQAVSRFLEDRVQDTRSAALLPRDAATYQQFLSAQRAEVWYLDGTNAVPYERREQLPLFRELAYIDANGRERLRIVDGVRVPTADLRDVSEPRNTTYRSETYFAETKALPPGEVYVGRVTGWYIDQESQLAGAEEPRAAVEGAKYEAVVRFATPVFDAQGRFDGMVMLALDHRHIFSFAIHIVPTDQKYAVFPDYSSGNYAYMFDDEGWEIVHPRFWVLRGLDPQGTLVPYITGDMPREQRGSHPFNLRYGGWADENLPRMYEAVRRGESGFVITVNQSNARKATTYAPIFFDHGVYRESKIFGGLAIGAEMDEFHQAADRVSASIADQQQAIQLQMALVIGGAVLAVLLVAALVTRSISAPVLRLSQAARSIARGEPDLSVLDSLAGRRARDEVSDLAIVFRGMAEQVIQRERNLKQQIVALNIQIDDQKKRQQVDAITETDYFQSLRATAGQMRRRHQSRRSAEEESESSAP